MSMRKQWREKGVSAKIVQKVRERKMRRAKTSIKREERELEAKTLLRLRMKSNTRMRKKLWINKKAKKRKRDRITRQTTTFLASSSKAWD